MITYDSTGYAQSYDANYFHNYHPPFLMVERATPSLVRANRLSHAMPHEVIILLYKINHKIYL